MLRGVLSLYLKYLVCDGNDFEIARGMWIMKEFQGKFLVMVWLVYVLI